VVSTSALAVSELSSTVATRTASAVISREVSPRPGVRDRAPLWEREINRARIRRYETANQKDFDPLNFAGSFKHETSAPVPPQKSKAVALSTRPHLDHMARLTRFQRPGSTKGANNIPTHNKSVPPISTSLIFAQHNIRDPPATGGSEFNAVLHRDWPFSSPSNGVTKNVLLEVLAGHGQMHKAIRYMF
jgi:hypothetical protein